MLLFILQFFYAEIIKTAYWIYNLKGGKAALKHGVFVD